MMMKCPRCGQMLLRDDLDQRCPSCGYRDYDAFSAPKPKARPTAYYTLIEAAQRTYHSMWQLQTMCQAGEIESAYKSKSLWLVPVRWVMGEVNRT